MDESTLRGVLEELIGEAVYDEENVMHETFADAGTESFAGAGLLTGNEGLVLTLATGEEFQITVVRSR